MSYLVFLLKAWDYVETNTAQTQVIPFSFCRILAFGPIVTRGHKQRPRPALLGNKKSHPGSTFFEDYTYRKICYKYERHVHIYLTSELGHGLAYRVDPRLDNLEVGSVQVSVLDQLAIEQAETQSIRPGLNWSIVLSTWVNLSLLH